MVAPGWAWFECPIHGAYRPALGSGMPLFALHLCLCLLEVASTATRQRLVRRRPRDAIQDMRRSPEAKEGNAHVKGSS